MHWKVCLVLWVRVIPAFSTPNNIVFHLTSIKDVILHVQCIVRVLLSLLVVFRKRNGKILMYMMWDNSSRLFSNILCNGSLSYVAWSVTSQFAAPFSVGSYLIVSPWCKEVELGNGSSHGFGSKMGSTAKRVDCEQLLLALLTTSGAFGRQEFLNLLILLCFSFTPLDITSPVTIIFLLSHV